MFSKSVEYALRAVVFLAKEAPRACATEEMAAGIRVDSVTYLSKVLQRLRRAGVIASSRGQGGGMTLARPASTLTILEVVNAVEPINRIKTCPLGLEAHGVRLCPLHSRIDQALAQVEQAFGSTTLMDLLTEKTGSPPLCEVPCVRGGRAAGLQPSFVDFPAAIDGAEQINIGDQTDQTSGHGV